MQYKVNNYMVLIVNNNKTFVTHGFYITTKFFTYYNDAREYMVEESKKFRTKEIDIEKDSIYIDCGDYYVEIDIIDCSTYVKITGAE